MVSAAISKRLQEGWTLLNEHCPMPSCCTPLLKNHKKEIYCAKCEMYCIWADEARSLGIPNDNASALAVAGDGAVPQQQQQQQQQQQHQASAASAAAQARHSRAAAEAAMGEKLLLGWTMLAQECPTAGCCFPLMRDRSKNTTCVACGGNGVAATATATPTTTATDTEGDSNSQFADPPAKAAPTSTVIAPPPAAPTTNSSNATEPEQQPVKSEEEFAAVRKKRDTLSASLGRYMLQGWSLLDRMCPREGCEPGTPLLRNRSTDTFYCAGCDTRMREGEAGGLVAESISTEASAGSTPAGVSLKRDSSGERNRSGAKGGSVSSAPSVPTKDTPMQVESEYELAEKARLRKQATREQSGGGGVASATLAQRLLQGWAMLSTTCPETGCHKPLMRDRNGKEQCVSCSSASVKSTAAAASASTAAHSVAAVTVPAQAAGDFAGEVKTADEQDQALLDDGAGRMYAERRMEELLAASAGVAATGTGRVVKSETEGDAAVDRLRVKSQTLDTLYRALDVTQQRLRACSSSLSSLDVDESIRQADLIAKLAAAARAVSELLSGN
eukprot:g9791.t1